MRRDGTEGRDRGWSEEQERARRERERERRPETRQPGGLDREARGARDEERRGELARGGGDERGWAEPWERDVTMRTEEPDWRNQERSTSWEHHPGRLGGYYERLEFGGVDRDQTAGWEPSDYGRGQVGGEEQADWRGPGELPGGYRPNADPHRARPFSQPTSSGQVPSEIREWGRRGDRGERRIEQARAREPRGAYGPGGDVTRSGRERAGGGDYPMREPWRQGPPGPGPDADRGPDGRRRSLEGRMPQPRGPHAGRGPKSYRRTDQRILEDVCDRLTAHPQIDARDIEVEVQEGKVVLRGAVPDRATKHRAEDLAEGLLGVQEVDNQLRVRRVGETGSGPAPGTQTDGEHRH